MIRILLLAFLAFLIGCARQPPTYRLGLPGHGIGTDDRLPVFTSTKALKAAADREATVEGIACAPRAGSSVAILTAMVETARITVTDGEQRGCIGFVPYGALVPPSFDEVWNSLPVQP